MTNIMVNMLNQHENAFLLATTELIGTEAESAEFMQILHDRTLASVFQPIINLQNGTILGHEALIRGPKNSHLHSPLKLFKQAKKFNKLYELERICLEIILASFSKSENLNKVFINVSPESLLQLYRDNFLSISYISDLGLTSKDIVIELIESSPTFDYSQLYKVIDSYRSLGFQIAIDDLGEGFSSLRLWSELRPDYVKIDQHFIQSINLDPVKLQFVKSIQQIAENSNALVIAEGVETQAELTILKDLEVNYCQGYLSGYPLPEPIDVVQESIKSILGSSLISVFPNPSVLQKKGNIGRLLVNVPCASPDTTNDEVNILFYSNPKLYSIPVIENDIPIGLISRFSMIDSFVKPYRKELYGKRSCMEYMDKSPLIVEHTINIHKLSDLITQMEPHYLTNGFIITNNGKYLGVGNGHSLLREITDMQISAARYANPLTLMPGNVPINEHIDRLLESDSQFWACYFDLDNFKPYNDAYGFKRGDELIQLVGKLLMEAAIPDLDFIGHIGGDDFVLICQSENWEERSHLVLTRLEQMMPEFYSPEDRVMGGIESEDRQGKKTFYPFSSLSVGVVKVTPKQFTSHHEVIAAMSYAKKQAKKLLGNSLFYERRLRNE